MPMPSFPFRIDLLTFTEVVRGNLNGNPDRDGAPRHDRGIFFATAACMRRITRDYLSEKHDNQAPWWDPIKRGTTITESIGKVAADVGDNKDIPKALCKASKITAAFGMVTNVGTQKSQNVTGCIATGMATSLYPGTATKLTQSRVCANSPKDRKNQDFAPRIGKIPHAVFRTPWYYNAPQAKKNEFTIRDLAEFLEALVYFADGARSVMRGEINQRAIFAFVHSHRLGNAPAHLLFDRVQVTCQNPDKAVSWRDYEVRVDDTDLPKAVRVVSLEQLLGGADAIAELLEGLQ